MATIRAKLLDEEEHLVRVVELEDTSTYSVNDHFRAPNGGLYLVCEASSDGAELTGIWIDGPHPASGAA